MRHHHSYRTTSRHKASAKIPCDRRGRKRKPFYRTPHPSRTQTNVPPSALFHINARDPVQAYSEQTKLWTPVFAVVRTERKIVWASHGVRVVQLHHSDVLPDQLHSHESTNIQKLLQKSRPSHTNTHRTVIQTEVLAPWILVPLPCLFTKERKKK